MNKKTCSIFVVATLVVTLFSGEIRTTFDGLLMNGNAEGCIAEPYKCQAGVKTIGVGSTTGKIEDRLYSNDEIAVRWVMDIKVAEQCVNRYFNGEKMGQNQFEAMTDLVFNIGCYGTRWNKKKNRPTMIYLHAQQQDWRKMCLQISDFNRISGKENKGLTNRRQTDINHCLKGL